MLTAKDWGHEGGNQVRAEFRSQGRRQPAADVKVNGKLVEVFLATDATGAPNSTAAQVVAAINAKPEAAALLTARPTAATPAPASSRPRARRTCRTSWPLPRASRVARSSSTCTASARTVTAASRACSCSASSTLASGPPASPASRPRTSSSRTTRRTRRPSSSWTTSRSSSRRTPTRTARTTRCTTSTSQRKTMPNYCPPTGNSDPDSRTTWGVDMNRNSGEYSLFDGYFGASTSAARARPTPVRPSTPSRRPVTRGGSWTRSRTSSSRTTSTPTAATSCGRRAPTRTTVAHDGSGAEHRHRELLLRGRREDPQAHQGLARHGDPAGAHGPDRRRALLGRGQLGRRRLVPQGHHRLLVRDGRGPLHSTTTGTARSWSASSRASARSAPAAAGHLQRQRLLVNEGRDEALEFAAGNYGLVESAYDYGEDTTAPQTALDADGVTQAKDPINYRFNWINESSVIRYTTDGSTPTLSSPTYNNQRARSVGQVLTISTPGTTRSSGWRSTSRATSRRSSRRRSCSIRRLRRSRRTSRRRRLHAGSAGSAHVLVRG